MPAPHHSIFYMKGVVLMPNQHI